MTFEAGEAVMWQLVQRYTGQVGYQRGVKSEGLSATPPVIDCSGWTALLLAQAMQAENEVAGRDVFGLMTCLPCKCGRIGSFRRLKPGQGSFFGCTRSRPPAFRDARPSA